MRIVSIKEFAEATGMKDHKVRELVRVEGFPAIQLGSTYQINMDDAESWLKKSYGKKFESEEKKEKYVKDRKTRLLKKEATR